MAEKRTWFIEAQFPSLPGHLVNQAVRVKCGNWKAALREGIRQLAKLDAVKGRKIRQATLTVVAVETGK
jgi:hypothetical protein